MFKLLFEEKPPLGRFRQCQPAILLIQRIEVAICQAGSTIRVMVLHTDRD